jgi:beta-phosphoglucomutase
MLELAIFDLDGVITSTTDAHFEAWKALFERRYGIILDSKLEGLTKGVSRMDSLNRLLSASGIIEDQSTKEAMAQEKNTHYRALIDHFSAKNLLPGVLDVIQFLSSRHLRIALGSASKNAPFLLEHLGISDRFEYVVNPSPLKGKPHPDIFLDAARHFGIDPKNAIGFEDAIAGITAIKRAGMIAVGVGDEDLRDADIHVSSLDMLSEETLEALIMGNLA